MKMKINLKKLLAVAVVSTAFTFAQAQPIDPGDDPGGGGNVPIDGGLSLLVAAGVGYAAKKRYDNRKKNNEQVEDNNSL